MSKPEPRIFSTLREVEFQLKPLLSLEAVEVLARAMARTVAHDPRLFTQLTDQFKHTFSREYEYLTSRQHEGHTP
jgi:hypothetical protein